MPSLRRFLPVGSCAQVATTTLLVLLSLPLCVRSQNVLQNPSFEDSATGFAPWGCIEGECGLDGEGVDHFAADGSQYAFLFPSSALSQQTTALTGATYYLSWSAYMLNGPPSPANLQVTFGNQGVPAFNVESASSSYVTVPNGTDVAGPYYAFGLNLTAQGNDNLTFSYFGGDPSADATSQNLTTAIRLDAMALTMVAAPASGSHARPKSGLTGSEAGLMAACIALVFVAAGGWASAWVMRRRVKRAHQGRIPISLPIANAGLEEKQGPPSSSNLHGLSYDAGYGGRPETSSSNSHLPTGGEVMVVSPSRHNNQNWDPYARDRYSVYGAERRR